MQSVGSTGLQSPLRTYNTTIQYKIKDGLAKQRRYYVWFEYALTKKNARVEHSCKWCQQRSVTTDNRMKWNARIAPENGGPRCATRPRIQRRLNETSGCTSPTLGRHTSCPARHPNAPFSSSSFSSSASSFLKKSLTLCLSLNWHPSRLCR